MLRCVLAILALAVAQAATAAADPTEDVAPAPDATVLSCPPAIVACDAPPPDCPPGAFAEAEPCPLGRCPERCWTGRCILCQDECSSDDDCVLVGRHGCCGDAGDCENGCFWSSPRSKLESDPCSFEAVCPVPALVPEGCPTQCERSDACIACPHCRPEKARCEGGVCTSAWPSCEPHCSCD